nr:phage tail tip lysozyme [Chelatococcus caeni]
MPTWLGGGGKTAPPTSEQKRAYAKESYLFWRSKGLSHEAALGLVANEQAESGFNPNARGDGGRAHGIFQHHPDRRAKILAGTGIDISTASHADQLKAAYWEMTEGQERATWRALQGVKSAGEAAAIVTRLYERPADIAGESRKRAAIAEGWSELAHGWTAPPAFDPGRFAIGGRSPWQMGGGRTMLMPPDVAGGSSNVNLHQRTEINVLGSSDPAATAQQVAGQQQGVNSTLLRNAQGAFR